MKLNLVWLVAMSHSLWFSGLQEALCLGRSMTSWRWLSWGTLWNQPPTYPGTAPGPLTKWHNDGAGDAVGHDDGEDAQHPRIHGSKLVLEGLVLGGGDGKELRGLVHPSPPPCSLRWSGRTHRGGLWKRETHSNPHLSRKALSAPPQASSSFT